MAIVITKCNVVQIRPDQGSWHGVDFADIALLPRVGGLLLSTEEIKDNGLEEGSELEIEIRVISRPSAETVPVKE